MWRKQADRFEASLQRAARGEKIEEPFVRLVKTAHAVAEVDVPPPPRGLVMGRRQLAAEASRLRPSKKRRLPLLVGRRLRLLPVVVSLLLLLVLLPIFTQEVSASLPGSPLYEFKVMMQDFRLWLTSSPQAHADLGVSVAERRLSDVAAVLEQGQAIDEATADSTGRQIRRAAEAVAQNPDAAGPAASQQLMQSIQNCEQVMLRALNQMSETDQRPVQQLLRHIERARQELHLGAGEAMGEQQRVQLGVPPDAEEVPGGRDRPDPRQKLQQFKGQGPEAGEPQGPADAKNEDPGQPAEAPKNQQESPGPGPVTEEPPANTPAPPAEPAPEHPQQPGGNDNGGQQQGPGEGPGGNPPQDSPSPGNKGNDGHSR